MPRDVVYVVMQGHRWAVVRSGTCQAVSLHHEEKGAISVAVAIAQRERLSVVVHDTRGLSTIRNDLLATPARTSRSILLRRARRQPADASRLPVAAPSSGPRLRPLLSAQHA